MKASSLLLTPAQSFLAFVSMVPTGPIRLSLDKKPPLDAPQAALEPSSGASVHEAWNRPLPDPSPCPPCVLKAEISALHSRTYSVPPANPKAVEPTFQTYS